MIKGTVKAVSTRYSGGILLVEDESRWYNGVPGNAEMVKNLTKDSQIQFELDSKGKIANLQVLGTAPAQPTPAPTQQTNPNDIPIENVGFTEAYNVPLPIESNLDKKDRRIVRQSSLKAAVELINNPLTIEQLKIMNKGADELPGFVLQLAEEFERWVMR